MPEDVVPAENSLVRLCIPIHFQPHGGGHYFLQSLAEYLQSQGWCVAFDIEASYDVLFTNHWMVSSSALLRGIRRNPEARIIQRVDGAAADYGRLGSADRDQRSVSRLADLVVFQSEYCRNSTRVKFPVIQQDGPVIHNPVDVSRFCPGGPKANLPAGSKVACVSWSTNPNKGARSIYETAARNPDVFFILCGRYLEVPDIQNLVQVGVLDRDELPRVLRACDALLTFSKNEACPNHVLEALATGLPILYDDSGAMAEVVRNSGLPVTIDDFREKFETVLSSLGSLRVRARRTAVEFHHPDLVFRRYMDTIRECRERPTQIAVHRRKRLAQLDPVLHPVRFALHGWR